MNGTAIILQARVGSRRLPGKVLAPIGSATMLEHCVTRLAASDLPVIVATSDRPDDDAVEDEARHVGAQIFRGSEADVLGRYIDAARAFGISTIIRATGDNPFVDRNGARRLVRLVEHVRADHIVERGLPIGAAVELVTLDALERSRALITDAYDREHVTSFVRRDGRFRPLRAVAPSDVRRPELRLTVDTDADLAIARAIAGAMAPGASLTADLASIIGVAESLAARTVLADRIRTERKGA